MQAAWLCLRSSAGEREEGAGRKRLSHSPIMLLLLSSGLVMSDSVSPRTAAHQPSLSSIIFQTLLKFMSLESVMPSNHLILCHPLLSPSIFPSIRVFSNESALHIRWPKYWSFSFSISPSNSGLISFRIIWFNLLLSKVLSRVFSKPQIKDINSLALSLLYGPPLTSIHDYWKNHSFDYSHLCRQSNVSAFEYTI